MVFVAREFDDVESKFDCDYVVDAYCWLMLSMSIKKPEAAVDSSFGLLFCFSWFLVMPKKPYLLYQKIAKDDISLLYFVVRRSLPIPRSRSPRGAPKTKYRCTLVSLGCYDNWA